VRDACHVWVAHVVSSRDQTPTFVVLLEAMRRGLLIGSMCDCDIMMV